MPIQADWEKFTYVSQSTEKTIDDDSQLSSISEKVDSGANGRKDEAVYPRLRSLAESSIGDRVCVVSLDCGEANYRLMAMGLTPGTNLQVISSTLSGSVIVALQEQRFGLGAEIAQRIHVSTVR
ncbi:MAG: ferrous iron transport protein A [Oscillatoriales cyanobacterium C42_A2020_001]|nr:ferrous iron transport protein A [Leptolyngbyaceae cyanobacterium C42_A2020_001]